MIRKITIAASMLLFCATASSMYRLPATKRTAKVDSKASLGFGFQEKSYYMQKNDNNVQELTVVDTNDKSGNVFTLLAMLPKNVKEKIFVDVTGSSSEEHFNNARDLARGPHGKKMATLGEIGHIPADSLVIANKMGKYFADDKKKTTMDVSKQEYNAIGALPHEVKITFRNETRFFKVAEQPTYRDMATRVLCSGLLGAIGGACMGGICSLGVQHLGDVKQASDQTVALRSDVYKTVYSDTHGQKFNEVYEDYIFANDNSGEIIALEGAGLGDNTWYPPSSSEVNDAMIRVPSKSEDGILATIAAGIMNASWMKKHDDAMKIATQEADQAAALSAQLAVNSIASIAVQPLSFSPQVKDDMKGGALAGLCAGAGYGIWNMRTPVNKKRISEI